MRLEDYVDAVESALARTKCGDEAPAPEVRNY